MPPAEFASAADCRAALASRRRDMECSCRSVAAAVASPPPLRRWDARNAVV